MGYWESNSYNYMFDGCSSLTSLEGISKWQAKNVINMSCMFNGCSSLKLLDDFQNGKLRMLII